MSGLAGRIGELEEAEKRLEVLAERIEMEIGGVEEQLGDLREAAANYAAELYDYMAEHHLPAVEEFVGHYAGLAKHMDVTELAEWAALVRVRDGVDGRLPDDFPDASVPRVADGMPSLPGEAIDSDERWEALADRLSHCGRYVEDSGDVVEEFTETARKAAEAGASTVAMREFAKVQAVCAEIPVAYEEWWDALGESSNYGTALLGPVLADHMRHTLAELRSHKG